MILKQYYLGCLAHASYLLGDETSSTAVIVDPQRDIQQYLDDAAKLGLQIRHVFLTHFHADFVAGHLELRDRCGATIHLGSRAQAEYSFVAMKDGDRLDFPGMRLEVLETPGHTIESISILVFDLQKDATKPYAVLTGDTLFIGDVGRPDLRASIGWTAQGPRGAALRLAAQPAHAASGRDACLSGAWGWFSVWKTALLRYGVFPRRSAPFELRFAADVEGAVHSDRDGGPA